MRTLVRTRPAACKGPCGGLVAWRSSAPGTKAVALRRAAHAHLWQPKVPWRPCSPAPASWRARIVRTHAKPPQTPSPPEQGVSTQALSSRQSRPKPQGASALGRRWHVQCVGMPRGPGFAGCEPGMSAWLHPGLPQPQACQSRGPGWQDGRRCAGRPPTPARLARKGRWSVCRKNAREATTLPTARTSDMLTRAYPKRR